MADEGKQVSALLRRHQQLKRWEDSETNRESGSPKPATKKVKFQDGCVFLAACSSGDKDEVKKLLDRGADINTANVDGLTALHQACIDDNLDMVEFLVEENADVDVCDNEGWTPLHATASCGFTEIARYLLKHGANVAAVNNDGDLAIDIAEDEEMENLLQEEMDKKGVDAEAARREEEDCMMADANRWLQNNNIEDNVHPKTGATALHVAAAKGYVNVMNVLLQAGANINAQDNDGWTPLHAAVHWGQEDSCQTLVDHLCDMDLKNNAGHTVFDLADKDMLKILEELKKKQVTLRTTSESNSDIIHTPAHSSKRSVSSSADFRLSSVTRMSSDQKQNVITKTSEEERATLDANLSHLSSTRDEEDKTPVTTPSTQDAETERKNELNKQASLISQPQSPRSRPASLTTSLDALRPEMPKIDEVSEPEKNTTTSTTTIITSPTTPIPSTPSSVLETGTPSDVASTTTDGTESIGSTQEGVSKNDTVDMSANELTVPSWRRGLRKTTSTSMVHEQMNENEDKSIPRSASSPRLALDNRIEILQDRINARLSSTSSLTSSVTSSTSDSSTDSRPGDRFSWSAGQSSYTPYRDYLSRSGYKPYYQRQQELNQQKEQERDGRSNSRINRPASTISLSTSSSSSPSPLTSTTTATTTVATTSTTTNSVFRRSYEPPKRDEETETQRKARAKHARQTRRSTQGVSLEDIEKAEEVLRQGDSSKKNSTEDSASSSRASIRDSQRDTATATTTTTTTATTTTTPHSSSLSITSSSLHNDRDRTSNLSSRDSFRDETSSYRRRNFEDRLEGDSTRSSFRRPREDRDSATNNGTSSSDITSSYVPRSQRNALSTSDINTSSLSSSTGLSRSASLRSRLRNGETESTPEDDRKKEETKESRKESSGTEREERKETAAIKARRKRQERRSTGINYVPGEEEKGKENKPEDEEKEESSENSSSRFGRYSSSDVPSSDSSSRNRPVSYSEHSRSTTNLDEYKKLYEEEKEENGRLRKELEQTKKDLLEAKNELDRLMRRNESSRNTDSTDKREKRALERKVSEYEEELKKMEALKADNQRLKDENGALIRVISKLSK